MNDLEFHKRKLYLLLVCTRLLTSKQFVFQLSFCLFHFIMRHLISNVSRQSPSSQRFVRLERNTELNKRRYVSLKIELYNLSPTRINKRPGYVYSFTSTINQLKSPVWTVKECTKEFNIATHKQKAQTWIFEMTMIPKPLRVAMQVYCNVQRWWSSLSSLSISSGSSNRWSLIWSCSEFWNSHVRSLLSLVMNFA